MNNRVSQVALGVKNRPANAGNITLGSIPGWGKFPGEGNGNPLQYSCLENPMSRGTWRATVHSVAKSWTWLKLLSTAQHIWTRHLLQACPSQTHTSSMPIMPITHTHQCLLNPTVRAKWCIPSQRYTLEISYHLISQHTSEFGMISIAIYRGVNSESD